MVEGAKRRKEAQEEAEKQRASARVLKDANAELERQLVYETLNPKPWTGARGVSGRRSPNWSGSWCVTTMRPTA